MWEKFLGAALDGLGDVTAPGWPADRGLEKLDGMSAAEFLRSRGASPGAVSLLRVGYLDRIGNGIETYSALMMLHALALRRTETTRYAIKGGTDLLPKAFAASLGARIRYQAPVVRIEPGERSASVIIGDNGKNQRLTADHVVCTVPFSVLKHIEVVPPFSPQKTSAIHQLPYTSVAGVFLQFGRKVWRTENLYITADADGAIKWVFEHTVYQSGPRGVLEAQATGAEARGLTRMTESDRIRFALEETEKVYPGIREEFERGASKCWDEDPWALGAFAYFRPGEMLPLLPHLGRVEGRVHFAGEHTSRWSGWMQGALESGLRVAREINSA
jgi:monoamine oxidase